MTNLVKLVVTVPETHVDLVREAIANAGGGKTGNYSHTSFSVKGVGRFIPLKNANPAIGTIGNLEKVPEERIEITCNKNELPEILNAVRKSHPYEEPVIDLYPLLAE